jgi:hypothetical protein
MRRFLWRILGREPRGSHGECASCSSLLRLCPACDGGWRGAACHCGLGLMCPTHGRFWMH